MQEIGIGMPERSRLESWNYKVGRLDRSLELEQAEPIRNIECRNRELICSAPIVCGARSCHLVDEKLCATSQFLQSRFKHGRNDRVNECQKGEVAILDMRPQLDSAEEF